MYHYCYFHFAEDTMTDLTEAEKKCVIDFHKKLDPFRQYGTDGVIKAYSAIVDDYDEMARIIQVPYKVSVYILKTFNKNIHSL